MGIQDPKFGHMLLPLSGEAAFMAALTTELGSVGGVVELAGLQQARAARAEAVPVGCGLDHTAQSGQGEWLALCL